MSKKQLLPDGDYFLRQEGETVRKILYIIPYLSIGGTEKHLLDLVRGFSGEYGLFLLAPPGETLDQFRAEKLEYYPFPRLEQHPFSGLRIFFKQLKTIITENEIDLIHIHAASELVLLVRMVAPRRLPIVFTVHGYHGPLKDWDYWVCARMSNRLASRVVVVAEAERKLLLKKGIRKDLITCIHNGVPDPLKLNLSKPASLQKIPPDHKIIGAIARLEATKGIDFLLRAFAELVKAYKDLHLVVVGAGSKEAELKAEAENLGLDGRVSFTGYQRNVHDYLYHFSILVIPSLHEAHPLVLLEGLGHGKPIVATTVGGIPEVIEDGVNGMLVPPADAAALIRKLSVLLNDTELQQRLGMNARKTYEEEFTVERMLEKTRKLYESLLGVEEGMSNR